MKPALRKNLEKNKNLYFTTEWLNMPKVLTHKNVKISLNHGGLNSIKESLYAGLPIIINPVTGD